MCDNRGLLLVTDHCRPPTGVQSQSVFRQQEEETLRKEEKEIFRLEEEEKALREEENNVQAEKDLIKLITGG